MYVDEVSGSQYDVSEAATRDALLSFEPLTNKDQPFDLYGMHWSPNVAPLQSWLIGLKGKATRGEHSPPPTSPSASPQPEELCSRTRGLRARPLLPQRRRRLSPCPLLQFWSQPR